jgi:opacity protein-like surface antigen
MGPVARRAVDWSAEVGVNLKSFFPHVNAFPVVYPFVHYNYYNPQETCEEGLIGDNRCQVSLWSFGLNWRPLSNLVVKADYTTRQIGTGKMFGSGPYNSENEFRIGIAYQLWFARK